MPHTHTYKLPNEQTPEAFPKKTHPTNSIPTPRIGVQRVGEENNQDGTISRHGREDLLPARLGAHGASRREDQREDKDGQDLEARIVADAGRVRGLKFKENNHGEEKQDGGKDGEDESEEDVETVGRDQKGSFVARDGFLFAGAEDGLSKSAEGFIQHR